MTKVRISFSSAVTLAYHSGFTEEDAIKAAKAELKDKLEEVNVDWNYCDIEIQED
jgi:hypothetical protein